MKVEISKVPYKDRWIAEQVAYTLEDMIIDIMENNGQKKGYANKFHKGIP